MTVTVTVPATMSYDGTEHIYSDDSNPTTGLDGGGHVDRFTPAIKDVVSVASYAVSTVATASADAVTASNAAIAATAKYDEFDDRYLGAKTVAPTLDNDGNALLVGAMYFNSSVSKMQVWTGSSWQDTGSSINGTMNRYSYTATASQTTFSAIYDIGYVDVYYNGVKLSPVNDFAATNGTTIVLTTGAVSGTIIDIIGYGVFEVADLYNIYTKTETNTLLLAKQDDITYAGTALPVDITALLHTTALYF